MDKGDYNTDQLYSFLQSNAEGVNSLAQLALDLQWDAEIADTIWTEACGKHRWKRELENLEEKINKLSDETLWQFRNSCRNNLVNYTRKRVEEQLIISGQPREIVACG